LDKLNGKPLASIENKSITIPDLLSVALNVTNITLDNMSLNEKFRMIQLDDDEVVLGVENFTASVDFGYMYVTDPPILADIGDFSFLLNNFTSVLNITTYFD